MPPPIFPATHFTSLTEAKVMAALDDPQAHARGDIVSLEHPDLGTVREVASPLRLSGAEPPLRRAPFRGEQTEQILVELCGYTPERVRELAAAGVFGEGG